MLISLPVFFPDTSREIGATSGSAPDPEVKSSFGEGTEEGNPILKQSSVLASFRGFRPMSTYPEISLGNPRVEIEGTLQGSLVERPTDNRSSSQLALDAFPSETVSICLHLSIQNFLFFLFFFEGFVLL